MIYPVNASRCYYLIQPSLIVTISAKPNSRQEKYQLKEDILCVDAEAPPMPNDRFLQSAVGAGLISNT